MDIEVTIEGQRDAILELVPKVKGFSGFSGHIERREDSGQKANIIFIENEKDLDDTLLKLSRIVAGLEKSLSGEKMFEFRTRNLAYSEPDGSSERFKNSFKPIPSIKIQPWYPSIQPVRDPGTVIIDPHHAFGSGTHPTTRLCLECMEQMAKSPDRDLLGREVLDFGCGTGLLAISAIKLGAEKAIGVDIVEETAQAARRNVELNGLSEKVIIRYGGWDRVDQKFDLIFANLVAAALLRSGDRIPHFLNKGGRAVISGFSLKQMEEMESFFKASGLKTIHHSDLDGWGLLFMEKGKD